MGVRFDSGASNDAHGGQGGERKYRNGFRINT